MDEFIKIEDIKIPKRYREDYGEIHELARSIALNTLFNPIVLTSDMTINQGGRRLSAIFLLKQVNHATLDEIAEYNEILGEDMVIILRDCKDPNLKKGLLKKDIHVKIYEFEDRHHELCLELEENLQRKQLDYKEEAMLIKAIHEQYQELHGKSSNSGRGWGVRDTGQYLGISYSKVAQDIKIAKAIESGDIDVAQSADRASAYKTILVKQGELIQIELQRRKQERFKNMQISGELHKKDALALAKSLSKNSFCHIITDPPYAIEFDKLTESKSESKHYLEMSKEEYLPYMAELSKVLYQKFTLGFFVCFCAFEYHSQLSAVIREAGFSVSGTPLIWYKEGSPGKNNHPDRQLTDSCEFAVVGWKGLPELNMPGRTNIFKCANYIDVKTRFHITQKPVQLLEDIVIAFTNTGDTVLDLFMGSGSTIKACIKTKRNYIGNDKSEYFEQAKIEILELEDSVRKDNESE